MSKGLNVTIFFYGAMTAIPALLFLIAVLSSFQALFWLRDIFAVLLGIGSIVFGVIGFWEVFLHGK